MGERKLAPIHPGEILDRRFLKPLSMSQNRLATELRIPSSRVTPIVNGKRRITPELALRLGRFFNTGPEFWMNLQQRYDLEVAQDRFEAEVEKGIEPIDPAELPAVERTG